MAAKKGISAIWYLTNLTVTSITPPGAGAYSLTGTFQPQSTSGTKTADTGELKDANGDVVGKAYTNSHKTATYEAIPSGATLSAAKGMNLDFAIGSKIVFADSDDAYLAGNWIVESLDWKGDNASARALTFHIYQGPTDISADMNTG